MTNQGSGNAYTTSGTQLCLELAAQAELNFAAGRKSVRANRAQIDGRAYVGERGLPSNRRQRGCACYEVTSAIESAPSRTLRG